MAGLSQRMGAMNRGSRPRIAIVDGHKKEDFFAPLRAVWDADWLSCVPAMLLAGETDGAELILVNDESWPDVAAALPALEQQGIPSLHLPDGIVEWRNQWERPDRGPQFHPVLSTRIACLGHAQQRLMARWGNGSRCLVTGSPRFDQYLGMPRRTPPGEGGPFHLLVATARTPAFSDSQFAALLDLLQVVRDWARSQANVAVTWRLTGGLDAVLGVANRDAPLHEELKQCDAVWTSPSTLQLEAMLAGLPVALLDPFARPLYVPAAWYVRHQKDCGEVCASMRRGDAARWAYQEETLADQVDLEGPAAPKVARAGQALLDAARAGSGFHAPRSEPWRQHPETASAELNRLRAENQALRRVANRTTGQTLYRLLTELERRVSKRN
ncbi:MAG: hypothetical protein JNK87_12760 [Bryobacterales bacterium]|nr:hypothetical protein [Bryobacterales bacterium]